MCGQGFMIGPGLGYIVAEIIADNTDKYNFITEQLTLYRNFSGEEMLK
jgi:sarcosine oxidase subunit beta